MNFVLVNLHVFAQQSIAILVDSQIVVCLNSFDSFVSDFCCIFLYCQLAVATLQECNIRE